MDLYYISITRLAPRVEINKQIFVVVYSIFTGFTKSISYFQVFYTFFILSFLYIFRFCLAFVFSWFTFLLYYEVIYFFLILSFLPISSSIFRFSISSILSGFTIFSIFSSFLYFLDFYAFHMFYILNSPYLFLQVFCLENILSTGLYYKAKKCLSYQ